VVSVEQRVSEQRAQMRAWPLQPSSGSSATNLSPSIASGSGDGSARLPWSPTGCTRAPTGSQVSPSWSAPPVVEAGWKQADPIIGLLITVAIHGVLRSALRQVGAKLMDAVDPELVQHAITSIASAGRMLAIEVLRIRWSGHTPRAGADITVSADLGLMAAHDIAHHAEQPLLTEVARLTAATVHAGPAGAHMSPMCHCR
jgi:hypothetical protein